jgi:hypothetical protein
MLKKFVIRANKKMWQNLYNMPSKTSYYIVSSLFLKSLLENRENRIDPTQQSPHPSKLVRKGNKQKKHSYQINEGKQKLKKKRATENFSKL